MTYNWDTFGILVIKISFFIGLGLLLAYTIYCFWLKHKDNKKCHKE